MTSNSIGHGGDKAALRRSRCENCCGRLLMKNQFEMLVIQRGETILHGDLRIMKSLFTKKMYVLANLNYINFLFMEDTVQLPDDLLQALPCQ